MLMLTSLPGNPAHTLHNQYKELMSITSIEDLKNTALSLVSNHSGISRQNLNKFRMIVQQEHRLTKLQQYLTNFILAADGLKVIA